MSPADITEHTLVLMACGGWRPEMSQGQKFQMSRADKEEGNDAGLNRKRGKLTERERCLAFLILGAE